MSRLIWLFTATLSIAEREVEARNIVADGIRSAPLPDMPSKFTCAMCTESVPLEEMDTSLLQSTTCCTVGLVCRQCVDKVRHAREHAGACVAPCILYNSQLFNMCLRPLCTAGRSRGSQTVICYCASQPRCRQLRVDPTTHMLQTVQLRLPGCFQASSCPGRRAA
jgi:hypothetical protein